MDQLNNQMAAGVDVGNSVAESIIYGGSARIKGKADPWQTTTIYAKDGNHSAQPLSLAVNDPDWDGFKFEDGNVRPVPIVYWPKGAAIACCWDVKAENLQAYTVLHATHVLFRQKAKE